MANDIQAVLGGAFDASQVEPQGDRTAIPAGVYDVEITSAEVAETKSGSGVMLKIEYTVNGPTHAGRKVFQNINLKNTSQEAERIGQSQLSSLCRAVGLVRVSDSDELMGRVVRIRVKVRAATEQYGEQNEVQSFEVANGTPAVAPAAKAAAKPAAAPWAKKAAA